MSRNRRDVKPGSRRPATSSRRSRGPWLGPPSSRRASGTPGTRPSSAFSPSGGSKGLRPGSSEAKHAALFVVARERKPEERGRMSAPTRRHEPGGFAEEARRIGAQLDEQILDGLVQGLPEAEDPMSGIRNVTSPAP